MRLTLIALLLCPAVAAPVIAHSAEPESSAIQKAHPGVVALSQDTDGNYQYHSFPDLWMLYVYDGDVPGDSTCRGCSFEWLPLLVSEGHNDLRVGDWTVVARQDGQRQWAYKGHLVYIRYRNMPPDSNSEEQGFHLLVP